MPRRKPDMLDLAPFVTPVEPPKPGPITQSIINRFRVNYQGQDPLGGDGDTAHFITEKRRAYYKALAVEAFRLSGVDAKDHPECLQAMIQKCFTTHQLTIRELKAAQRMCPLHRSAVVAYGMRSNTPYFAVIEEKLVAFGSKVNIYLDVDQIFHALPQEALTAKQREEIASKISDLPRLAELKSEAFEEREPPNLGKMVDKDDDDENIPFHFISLLSDHSHGKLSEASADVQRYEDARNYDITLRRGPDETENQHWERILQWVKDQNVAQRATPETQREAIPLLAIILISHQISTLILLFSMSTSQDSRIGHMAFNSRLCRLVSLQGYCQRICRSILLPRFKRHPMLMSLYYDIDSKSSRIETSVVYDMNNRFKADSVTDKWWQYLLQCRKSSQQYRHDLLQVFPSLKAGTSAGQYFGEREKAIRAPSPSYHGKVFIIGCPGTGKSDLAETICNGVMAQSPNLFTLCPPLVMEDDQGQEEDGSMAKKPTT
ncbi:hypothetical protein PT974_02708 [Cladobotryum mycophilum]|uniref:Uncharacterized protein n=1 Tax=Cladobotryum mycophilum TaxID=491253 RepID=A0ABR0SZP8_9HYPO